MRYLVVIPVDAPDAVTAAVAAVDMLRDPLEGPPRVIVREQDGSDESGAAYVPPF